MMKLLKYIFFLLIFATALQVVAQKENATWYFGKALGISFANGTAKPLNTPAHASNRYITSTSCISDKKTGAPLFYTNGQKVFNRLHGEMSLPLSGNTYSQNLLIVPDPGDSMAYYLLYAYGNTLFQAKVNMRLKNGLGDLVYVNQLLFAGIDNRFAVVKQTYNAGYWLITHVNSTKQFYTYRITKDTIETTPVISSLNENYIWPDASNFYSEIVTTIDGTQFAVMENNSASPLNKFILLYNFDKKCGTVTLKREISSPFFLYDIAYDATARFLYVISNAGGSDKNIVQYDIASTNATEDVLPGTPIIKGNYPMYRMKLAPDDKIYISKQELIGNGYSPSRYIDVIHAPSVKGELCNYQERVFNLSPGNQCFNDPCYLTDRFPNMIMDRTITQPYSFEEPLLSIENFCFGESTSFDILNDSLTSDNFWWDFGDSTKEYNRYKTNHIFKNPGKYYVSFNWSLCGLNYSISREISIGLKPDIHLGSDTSICFGTTLTLSPGIGEKYLWSTGDTTSTLIANKAGIISVQVSNGSCISEDEIRIEIYPQVWTLLGEEYFICDRDKELVKLDAGPGFNQYKWTPGNDTSQWIIVGDLGNYFVIVKDFRGCDGSDGTIVKRICPVELFFPNAFTPNDDGLNDTYLPIGNSVVDFQLTIFNRWGQIVFETNNLQTGWNGKTDKNNFAPSDIYFYQANYSGYINKVLTHFTSNGNLQLIR